MEPDQFGNQGKAYAAALMGAAAHIGDAVEPFEKARHLLGGYASAGIPYPKDGA